MRTRNRWIPAAALCLAIPLALRGEVKGTCEQAVEASVQPGAAMRMRFESGDISIAGVARSQLRVTCELSYPEKAKKVSIQYESGELRISGGPKHEVHFKIEVPRNTNLFIRSPHGDLTISGVAGDKDIEMHSGDATIDVGNPADYKHADASVWAGNLTAAPFAVDKDGLFRRFNRDNAAGKYSLHVHVFTGDVTLR